MPCFVCNEQTGSWVVVVYYVVLLICANTGWGLTQANFLTLIPEIARRQSEMVKLGAIRYVKRSIELDYTGGKKYYSWKGPMALYLLVENSRNVFHIAFFIRDEI
jgi:hypothetical protein